MTALAMSRSIAKPETCEISLSRAKARLSVAPVAVVEGAASAPISNAVVSTEDAYFAAHSEWVTSIKFRTGLKDKLKANPFLFPLVLATANKDVIGQEAYAKLRQIFYQHIGEASSALAEDESAELDAWLKANFEGPKALQALYAKKTFKKVLGFEEQVTFEGNSVTGLADKAKARGSKWKQFLALPKTLRSLKKLIDDNFKPSTLDENLYAFYGFHQNTADRFYGQRPWEKVNLGTIDGSSIKNLTDSEFVGIMVYAMEIEDPILGYSWASGQGFRFLLPLMGRFMGKNEEEAEHIRQLKAKGDEKAKWCESPWCEEERRHGNMWAKLTSLISGSEPNRDNPVEPYEPSPNEDGAQFHHYSRQSTEWSATSSYLVLAAHAEGDLQQSIVNVAADEIKHLTLLTAAQTYLFGYSPWVRLTNMVKKSWAEFRSHKNDRSTGGEVSSNPITFFEILVSHVMTEIKMRQYMRTLPLGTLHGFFESQSKLPELDRVKIPADLREEMEVLQSAGSVIRQDYLRWSPKTLAAALKQVGFEKINQKLVSKVVEKEFANFAGAEDFESLQSMQIQKRINEIDLSAYKFIGWNPNGPTEENFRKALYHRLREFQILNNAHIRDLREKQRLAAEAAALKQQAAATK